MLYAGIAKRSPFWFDGIVLLSIDRTAMDDSQKKSRSKPAIIASGIVLIVLGALLYSLSTAAISIHHEKCGITKSIANCRQIILSIRLYAADEGGIYPDARVPGAKDSNTVFRQLIVAGSLEDEKIFGAPPCSPFVPDGVIGSAPDYAQAVERNENHWAVTTGLNDSSPRSIPLVYENPVDSKWPPTWNSNASDLPAKGTVLTRGKVVVGTGDTSVELMKLSSTDGERLPLKPMGVDGLDIFGEATQGNGAPKCTVLDIAWDQSAIDAKVRRDSIQKTVDAMPGRIAIAVAILVVLLVTRSMIKKRRKRAEPAQT
jgi:hypothetical protein